MLRLMREPLRFIGTIQLAISTLGILVGALGEPALRRIFHPPLATGISFVLAIALMTFFSVLVGDLVPKAIALQRAERLALQIAPVIAVLEYVTFPVVWVLQTSAAKLLRPFGLSPPGVTTFARSEQDLRGIVGEAEESGVIVEAQEELLSSVFDFAAAKAPTLMIPREEIDALPVEMTVTAALEKVLDAPYTCHPVFDGDLDHVVGLLYLRDLFTAVHRGTPGDALIGRLLRPAYRVPASKDLGALLAELRRMRQLMAIVVDEAGRTTGVVTLEDVLEEIVGEIADAYQLPDESVRWVDDRTVRVAGTFPIDDFNESFETKLPETCFHTLAGLTYDRLGRVAAEGDALEVSGTRLRVIAVEGPLIRTVEVCVPSRTGARG